MPSVAKSVLLPLLAAAMLLPVRPVLADEIDELVDAKLQAMNAFFMSRQGNLTEAEYRQFMGELVADIPFESLRGEHLAKLRQVVMSSPEAMAAATKRADELAEGTDAAAAAAAITHMELTFMAQQAVDEASVRRALGHPGLGAAFREGQGGSVFQLMAFLEPEKLQPYSKEVLGIENLLGDDLPPQFVGETGEYVIALSKLGDAADKATRDRIRQKVLKLHEAAAAEASESGQDDYAAYLEAQVKFLDGAFARGELIGHPAPALHFAWWSGDGEIATLADLKGKVVVLDFWATWCGPCVASFPNVRDLRKHYEGYDVEIVGVTSLQGSHYPGDGPPISTEGDPAREYELMRSFMQGKDMTWPVAFTTEEVFNPDYGVRGIPHLAIVGPDGTVRYNGLHPAEPMEQKVEKINALLVEAGKKTPPAADKKQASAG